jgi:actin-related protein
VDYLFLLQKNRLLHHLLEESKSLSSALAYFYVLFDRLTELMFEKFQTSAFFLSKDAVLSCYSVGKTTGLIIDCGGGGTVVSPVVDGWIELKALSRSNLSGRLLDAYMLSSVTKKLKSSPRPLYRLNKTVFPDRNNEIIVSENAALLGKEIPQSFQSYMNLELGRDIKEAVCKVTEHSLVENEVRYSSLPTTSYELPDGNIVDLGVERFQVPELLMDASPIQQLYQLYLQHQQQPQAQSISSNTANTSSSSGGGFNEFMAIDELQYFQSSSMKATAGGGGNSSSSPPSSLLPFSLETIPKMACDSVLRSDQDAQNTLLANMVLTGGNSCYDGLLERCRSEIEKRIHLQAPGMKIKMASTGNTERSLNAWLGGSIVGSLGSFHEIWINKKEYDEYGSHIVDRKCP